MDIIPDQIKESPAVWEFFSWWYMVLIFLYLVAGLSFVAIVGALAKKFGGDPADFFYLGLKFPPGHWSHKAFFSVMDILRLYAILMLVGAIMFNVDWSDLGENDWWHFFVIVMAPTVLGVAVLYTLVDFMKMVWIGGPDEWKRYMDAYGTDISAGFEEAPDPLKDLPRL